eukprot:jgi/Ulvmu1/3693/UM017_0110.1
MYFWSAVFDSRWHPALRALNLATSILLVVTTAALGDGPFTQASTRPAQPYNERHAVQGGLGSLGRALMDTGVVAASPDAVADITVVSTAEQLQAAVMSGAQDIELRAHVDLSDLALAFTSNTSLVPTVLGEVKPSTRSIRGNCDKGPPPAAAFGLTGPDFLWTAPQCVIVSDHDIIWGGGSSPWALWLDALLLRIRQTRWFRANMISIHYEAEIYGTRLTLQSDGPYNITAASVTNGAKALFSDCKFDSMGGDTRVFHTFIGSTVIKGSRVSNIRQRSSFAEYDTERGIYNFDAITTVSGTTASVTVLDTMFSDIDAVELFWAWSSLVVVDNVTYSNVTTERNQWDSSGEAVGPGDGRDIVDQYDGSPLDASPVSALTPFLSDAVPQLSLQDPWILAVQESIAAATSAQTQTAPEPPPNPPAAPALGVAGDAAPSVAAVYTAFQFQDAFHEGVRDIEIRDHLDLRNLPKPRDPIVELPFGFTTYQIGYVGTPTRSIRGKCTTPPTGPFAAAALELEIEDEEPWSSPRCVIITADKLFIVDRSRLWLDSLHIQLMNPRSSRSRVIPAGIWMLRWGNAYITNTVVQGKRASDSIGIEAFSSGGGVYAQGCVFNALEGDEDYHRAIIIINSNAFFKTCVFRGLSQIQVPDVPGQNEEAVGALHTVGLNATLALENCTIANSYNERPIVVGRGGRVYSDNAMHTSYESYDHRTFRPLPLGDLANRTARTPPPLQASDPWFVDAQKALAAPPASAYLPGYPIRAADTAPAPADPLIAGAAPVPTTQGQPDQPGSLSPAVAPLPPNVTTQPTSGGNGFRALDPPEPPGPSTDAEVVSGKGSDGPSTGLIIGIALAIVVLLCLCAVVAFIAAVKRRNKRKADPAAAAVPKGGVPAQGNTEHASQAGSAAAAADDSKPSSAMGPGGNVGAKHAGQGGFLGGMPPMAMYQYPPGHPYGYHPAQMHAHGQQMYGGPGMHMAPQMSAGGPNGISEYAAAPGGVGWHGQVPPPGYAHGDPRHMSMHRMPAHGGGPSFHCSSSHGSAPGAERGGSLNVSTATLTNITKATWTDFQKASGEAKSPVEELQVALDAMNSMQAPFYNRYHLASAVDRRVGGQGIVQFASMSNTHDRAAIKFYTDRSAFDRERELYAEARLKAMMPATFAVDDNESGKVCTPYGYKFPPFVIIECGQSLDEWARDNANKDFITVFQALSHAVRALRRLHDFGYAHRDIKPGNILRRPKQHDWTLIDFGCTAQIGSTAGLSFSLKYAAPEVVHALEAGSKTVHVDAAVDIWAFGVIAFELLNGERAFPTHNMSVAEAEYAAQEAIAGRAPLPWELVSPEAQQRLEKLRGMRRTVLRCLDRDPAKRPTAGALIASWDHAFDNMHTRGTDWSAGS